MNSQDKDVELNRAAWDAIANSSEPWFFDCTESELRLAREGDVRIKLTPTKNVPASWLGDLRGKQVLCLAGAGGQQAPLLAASGANVTVLDISEAQLARDAAIGEREQLEMKLIVGDMGDLSSFPDESFDLVVNPASVCYIKEVQPVWQECHRVLKTGGELIVGAMNPSNFLFDAVERDEGRLVVRHRIPYSDLELSSDERDVLKGPDWPVEFGHTLEALIGGQVKAGLHLVGFFEDRWGGEDRLSEFIDVFVCTRSRRTKK